jgi:hypothetical protein
MVSPSTHLFLFYLEGWSGVWSGLKRKRKCFDLRSDMDGSDMDGLLINFPDSEDQKKRDGRKRRMRYENGRGFCVPSRAATKCGHRTVPRKTPRVCVFL